MDNWIPESEEVRAEHRARIAERLAAWFKAMDTQEAMKVYFTGLLLILLLGTIGSGIKTVVNWCLDSNQQEDKHA